MLSNASSLKKLDNLQKRALRFLCNSLEISYEELLSKPAISLMNLKGAVMQITSSTQITDDEIFAFIPVLVFKLLSRKVLFTNRNDNRNC